MLSVFQDSARAQCTIPMEKSPTTVMDASTALASDSEILHKTAMLENDKAAVLSAYFGVDSIMYEQVKSLFDEAIISEHITAFICECKRYHEAKEEHAALPKVRVRQPSESQTMKLADITKREAAISK